MRIFYIQSGYKGIYPFIEEWIEEGGINNDFEFLPISPIIKPLELYEKIQSKKPDLALMLIANKIPYTLINTIKENQVPLAIWLTEDPFYMDISKKVLPLADTILTIDEGAAAYYQSLGYSNVHFFPLATNERVFKPHCIEKEMDLLIVGYPYPNRIKLVEYLLIHTDYSLTLIGDKWNTLLKSRVKRSRKLQIINRWLPPSEINGYYNQAKIIINTHREYSFKLNKNRNHIKNVSVNNRFFDIFSCGGFQLINVSITPPRDFSNETIISYSNEEDCVRIINKYIQSPSLIQEVTKIGRTCTLQNHTFTKRMEDFQKLIKTEKVNKL
jgi:spore maturation protein CgeB